MKWPVETIDVVAQVNPKLAATDRPDLDEIVCFVPMAAVSEKTLSIEAQAERPFSEVAKGYTPFKRDDVLVAKITPCFENGKMALADNLAHELGFGTTEFHVFRPSERITGPYLFNLLRAPYVRKAGAMKMKGAAGQRRVPADFFASLQIPLPPLDEQKRIAGILDAADALRAKRREALAQLDTLLQSTFLDMFGDPVTNPMGWMVTCVGDVTQMGTGSTPSRNHKNYFGGSISWVKSTEVDWGTVTATSECVSSDGVRAARLRLYLKGSIVLALYGQGKTRGKCAVLGIDATINQACCALVPRDPGSTPYLFQFLKYSYHRLRGESRGGNQENLNMRIVRSFPVPVPPLDVQQRYATIAESVEKQKTSQLAHLAELDTLFASLQSRAFRGDL